MSHVTPRDLLTILLNRLKEQKKENTMTYLFAPQQWAMGLEPTSPVGDMFDILSSVSATMY